ncbi:MAG TPA: 3-hydroxyacyl-CoA dehydrogenase NAD-binding domain-containing protein, partial [Candidatus Cybelea sp.]|nr:3-hydroxyacyl-CoA dehydrogenase NAD-binding domain-containing protein [Candidatus Cybelea sp.]
MNTTMPLPPSASEPIARPDPSSAERSLPGAPASEQPQRTVKHFIRDDHICVLIFDRPGSAANIFDRRTLTELGEELEFIAGAAQIEGVILTSAKRSIFIAGADLNMMSEDASPQEARELINLGQTVMNRLATLPIPTVAAIHGACVGGGYELCLACDHRVASTDRATKIGLPETMLGLLPAWGGSTRLPRLIGLPQALDIILAGKTLAAKQALKRGMVDELAPAEYLVEVAARMIRRGKPRRKGHQFVNNRLAASVIAARARSQVLKKTRGHYPAVSKALEVVTGGISKSIPESLALERDGILELAQTEACHNLIRVFFLQERAKKQTLSGAGSTTASAAITRAAVIGSGVMGAGIAQWLSARQVSVILKDINTEQVAKGMAAIAKTYQEGAKRHVFTAREARDGLDRIAPASTNVPLGRCGLIIEAAVENLELKKKIFQGLDEWAGENTILATNTSALPISELAASTRRPERVLGLHFFNPVHRMQLVEIVAARQTAPEVLQRALQFVRHIGKLPVIVKDSPGFLVNRILMPYLVEAGNLFESGASITNLDEAMLDFGMPMGPMLLLDEVGIDVARHVAQTLAAHYPDRLAIPETLNKMIQAGMLGRKGGRGFYLHRKGKAPQPYARAASLVRNQTASALTRNDLQDRMVLLMVNEAARCLEEQVVTDPADVDFAMIMGTGFAPFRGGPLRYADTIGVANLVAKMDRLAAAGATHFAPCALLRSLMESGQGFYAGVKAAHRVAPIPSPVEHPSSNGHVNPPALVTSAMPPITKPPAETPPAEARSLIDTSKMSAGQRAALELTEAAREVTQKSSFASGLFMGLFDPPETFPIQSAEDRDRGDVFLQKLEKLLREKVDPDEIDRTGEIPAPVIEELAKLGAFGIKISTQYGGLGLSQTNYCRAAMLLGRYCGNLTALLSAHQSIGVPQPLILFGTEEQKRQYLPRVAGGEISAFALTESGAGSDPAT